jgi:hypothetical protein
MSKPPKPQETTLLMASQALLNVIRDLAATVPGQKITYFEASPTKDPEAYRRWTALNDAGKELQRILDAYEASN